MTTVSIGTKAELIDFATNINDGTYATDTDAILTADITFTSSDTWTPIGNDTSHAYAGTFDGNGHTISSLSSSFCGYISGGKITKTKFANITSTSMHYIIAQYLRNYGEISQCILESCSLSSTSGTSVSDIMCPFTLYIGTNSQISDCCIIDCDFSHTARDVTIGGLAESSGTTTTVSNIYVSSDTNLHGTGVSGIATNTQGGSWTCSNFKTQNSVFLGTITTVNSTDNVGRIVAYTGITNLVNNYASSTSTINGAVPTSYVSTTQKNGANCYNTDAYADTLRYDKQAFYQTTLGWDFADTWYWDSDDSPKLQVFQQSSAPTVKVFNATSNTWVDGTPYVFNGTSWVEADAVYVYVNGSWVEKT